MAQLNILSETDYKLLCCVGLQREYDNMIQWDREKVLYESDDKCVVVPGTSVDLVASYGRLSDDTSITWTSYV